ncbi:MAG TPA: PemK family transcriptional regulator [Anaerolineaceae bacterium]|nr:PemK family transcriptional regulator [Anaerolineaceae bacterium]HAF47988.1 PemK family transcriptional regulator [Anaerolineaceae bacterium]
MHRGEIWLINLDPTIGAEIKKSRPAVIVNVDEIGVLPLRVIVPITTWKDHYSQAPWLVQISPTKQNGLDKPSAADTFQIRSLSTERFIRAIGKVDQKIFTAILDGVKVVIGV